MQIKSAMIPECPRKTEDNIQCQQNTNTSMLSSSSNILLRLIMGTAGLIKEYVEHWLTTIFCCFMFITV